MDTFNMANIKVLIFFFSTCMAITFIFLFFNHGFIFDRASISIQPEKERVNKCNLFEGQWISDHTEPLYTNYSCATIPLSKNCLLNGRKNTDFLHWRWKPNECDLPRFNPQTFLSILRGKTMAFVGDSLARNQMESLLCLLSTVEIPKLIEKDAEDKFTTWEFPKHTFSLMALWSQFLVAASKTVVNGTDNGIYDLQIDRVDPSWSEKLPSIDYAVFSAAHWFLRPNQLYENGKLIGCIFCSAPNGTMIGPEFAMKKAIRAAFNAVKQCKNCKKVTSFLTTFSPRHYENGEWNTGGRCNRTELTRRDQVDQGQSNWELSFRTIEVEEVDTFRNEGNNIFEVIDVTEMMIVRVDGHPDLHWRKGLESGLSDCTHWCLPGPIDAWNEILFEMIKRILK